MWGISGIGFFDELIKKRLYIKEEDYERVFVNRNKEMYYIS